MDEGRGKKLQVLHGCMKDQVNTNKISSLQMEDGSKVFKPMDIHSVAISHFQKLFSTSPLTSSARDFSSFVDKVLPPERAVDIMHTVTDEEVKGVVFWMNPDKAPGPDGFSAGFFQTMWHIVGDDVCVAAKSFFESKRLLKVFNCTAITLIPKSRTPSKLSDYRPISCCNIVYKIVGGVLAQRLKGLLPELISSDQTAFVPGRSIADNILLAQELLRNISQVPNLGV